MADTSTHSPLTCYFFLFLVFAGLGLFLFSLTTENQSEFFSGLQQMAVGLFLIGIGEWINHPLQKSVAWKDKKNLIMRRFVHRKRNPSTLGNLFEICGLILLFTGVADIT